MQPLNQFHLFERARFYTTNLFEKFFAYRTAPKISFLTCCRNRLGHLRETLPANLESNQDFSNLEFILLDYNSSDGLSDWVKDSFGSELQSGRIKFHRTEVPQHFEMAKAKNILHRLATGTVLCNLDADNFTGPHFANFLADAYQLNPNLLLTGHHTLKNGTTGRIAVRRSHFLRLAGYDEALIGYGYEDEDFIERCIKLGLTHQFFPVHFLNFIPHSDSLRAENLPPYSKDVHLWTMINRQISKRRLNTFPLKRNIGLKWGETILC